MRIIKRRIKPKKELEKQKKGVEIEFKKRRKAFWAKLWAAHFERIKALEWIRRGCGKCKEKTKSTVKKCNYRNW